MKRSLFVSYGSAVELGLSAGTLDAHPTTLYLFARENGCMGHCAFCPQSQGSSVQRISRVEWLVYPLAAIRHKMASRGRLQRICLQCSDEPSVRRHLADLVGELSSSGLPISVSTAPITPQLIGDLRDAGAERLTIPMDCAREDFFVGVKGRPMTDYWTALSHAVKVFGMGKVGTHLIVGLGESERDLVLLMSRLFRAGVCPSLFAFTPVRGTPMEGRSQPDPRSYRRLQLVRHLMASMGAAADDFEFDGRDGSIRRFLFPKEKLESAISQGKVFMTQGCPGCNRPYFNERVSGPIFNYPIKLGPSELSKIRGDLVGTLETC